MHDWDVDPKRAILIQQSLRERVKIRPLSRPLRTIAGADVSSNMFGKKIYAGIIVLSYPDLEPLEYALIQSETNFPYIPGLLSFREIPALLECVSRLKAKPDLIVVDGQGIAHPRRFGIASHLGVLADIPAVGCAKSRLYGEFKEPQEVGNDSPILDPNTSEELGRAFKSKKNSNPLIVSPGHMISVNESLAVIKETLRGYRLPEPTRRAHELVNKFRRGEINGQTGKNSGSETSESL
jgi:deoxyribonuclease V